MPGYLSEQFGLEKLPEYRKYNNYKVIDNPYVDNKKCLVCFSSNGLYFPNTDLELSKIIDNDRYEWENIIPKSSYSRVILLRDLYKQWYIAGISEQYNSVDKVKSLLKELCDGYDAVFIGSSAGGYAAALFGTLVGAKHSLCFAGQFDLTKVQKDEVKNKLLYDERDYKYININKFINNVFYFCPIESQQDKEQYQFVKNNEGVNSIIFKSNIHGIPFKPYAIKRTISLSSHKLVKLSRTVHKPNAFSLKYIHVNDFTIYIKRRISRILNKIFNKSAR